MNANLLSFGHGTESRPSKSLPRGLGLIGPMAFAIVLATLVQAASAAPIPGSVIPELRVGDQIFTNASVVRVLPAGLVIRHSTGGATVPYDELPPELSSRYPHPAAIASSTLARTAAPLPPAQQQRYQRDALHAHWLVQQRRVEQRLEPLRDELARIDRIMPLMISRAQGTGRRSSEHLDLIRLRERKIGLLNEISTIETELRRIRDNSLDALR